MTAELSLSRARAAARLRATDLSDAERRAVRAARGELGAALRRARRAPAASATVEAPPPRPLARAWPRRRLAALLPLLALLALLPREPAPEAEGGGGAPAAAAIVDAVVRETALSRGRSTVALTSVVVEPTPAPTVEPTAVPATSAPVAAPARTGTPGSGGGSGTGTGGSGGSGSGTAPAGSPAPAPTPTPRPAATPLPPRPVGYTRFVGQVVDQRTGRPVPGACVVVGVRQCNERDPYTDANGRFVLDLPSGRQWDVNFAKAGYVTAYRRLQSAVSTTLVDVGRIRLAR